MRYNCCKAALHEIVSAIDLYTVEMHNTEWLASSQITDDPLRCYISYISVHLQ